jgi:hypothetical protein
METKTGMPTLEPGARPIEENQKEEILSLLDAEIPEDQRERELKEELQKDGDRLFEGDFLEQLKKLHPQQRLRLMAESAGHIYVGADDFKQYFRAFPEDAKLVDLLVTNPRFNDSDNGYLKYILGCKVLESAAKTIPGRWQELVEEVQKDPRNRLGHQLPNYLAVSARSKLAREALLDDYKRDYNRQFGRFGPIAQLFKKYLDRTEQIVNGLDWGYVQPEEEVFNQTEFKNLAAADQRDFLKEVIIYCHQAIVFHEVHNSSFDEKMRLGYPILDNQRIFTDRWLHSIIYATQHPSAVMGLAKYHFAFKTNYTAFADGRPADETGYEKTIAASISKLAECGDSASIDFLLKFWGKNRDPAYGPAIAETISKIDAQAGVSAVLNELATASEPQDQRRLLSLLYRLELGQIGISEEGLNYLGRRFDLGEYNHPQNFAQRITADGKVGIFDQSRALAGFIQLEGKDFQQPSRRAIKKAMTTITQELLFYSKADETPEEARLREKILNNFCQKYFETFLHLFPQESNLHFNNLNLREQGWVLLYLDQADDEERKKFFDFASQFGEEGLRSLIAMEYGSQKADEVLNIGTELPLPQARLFFEHFSRLVTLAEEFGAKWESFSPENPFINPRHLCAQITEAILRKTVDFLRAMQEVKRQTLTLAELTAAMQEFAFVLDQLTEAIASQGESFQVQRKILDQPSHSTTWILVDNAHGWQVNLTVRPEKGTTIIKNKKTGERKSIATQPGIRADFVWPDKKRFGLRLDLDPHFKDEQFPHGRLSLDIGSRDSLIASLLDRISPEGGHHNILSFSPELSSPAVFGQICRNLNAFLAGRLASG